MLRHYLIFPTEELVYMVNTLSYRLSRSGGQSLQKILVNGTPRSGTTWILLLFSSIPGYRNAGNFDGEIARYDDAKLGDVVHGHDTYSPELEQILKRNEMKVVIAVRDPRDQLVSHLFHIRRVSSHPWHQKMMSLSIDEGIMACIEGSSGFSSIRSMMNISMSWKDAKIDVPYIKFEDLHKNTIGEYRRLLEHLDIELPDGFLKCIVDRNRFERLTVGRRFWLKARTQGQVNVESHFRKGIIGDWKNYFKPKHVKRFKELMGDTLIELGYESDYDWSND